MSIQGKASWTLLPAAILLLVGFFVPLLSLLPAAFGGGAAAWLEVLQPPFNRVVARTLLLGAIVAMTTTSISLPLAHALRRQSPARRRIWLMLSTLPLWASLLGRNLGWLIALQPAGVATWLLERVGFHDCPSLLFSSWAVWIAMVHALFPFQLILTSNAVQSLDPELRGVALTLGASPRQAYWTVEFPHIWPGLGAGAILVFSLAVGYYITPALLGGVADITVGTLVQKYGSQLLEWGLAARLSLLLVALSLPGLWALTRAFVRSGGTGA
jgi:putative spermidine/putrescine transport system permease protein